MLASVYENDADVCFVGFAGEAVIDGEGTGFAPDAPAAHTPPPTAQRAMSNATSGLRLALFDALLKPLPATLSPNLVDTTLTKLKPTADRGTAEAAPLCRRCLASVVLGEVERQKRALAAVLRNARVIHDERPVDRCGRR